MANVTASGAAAEAAGGFWTAIESYFYTILVGVVILIAGLALGILAKKLLQRFLHEIELNRILTRVGITTNAERWLSSIVSYVIYLLAFIAFLEELGIKSIVLYLFAGAVLMLVVLTFLVGLKDVIPNFIGWLYLQKKGSIREGRNIEVKEISGTIERIGYLETEIKTERGDILYVPNSLFLKSKHRLKG